MDFRISPEGLRRVLVSTRAQLSLLQQLAKNIDFGVDFGGILGAFGRSKSVIFGIDLLMLFACRSKSGLRAPKRGPRAPKSAPRAPKRGPRAAPKHTVSGKES